MKTITVLQPSATLISLGVQRIHVLTTGTTHRGPLAICATKGQTPKDVRETCAAEPFRGALALCDIPDGGGLPRGAVVGTVYLSDCVQVDSQGRIGRWSMLLEGLEPEFSELLPGRWVWVMTSPHLVRPPLKTDEQLGVWNWYPPNRRGWQEPPWWVLCQRPGCRARTTVGVRARMWPEGICDDCRNVRRALPEFGSPGQQLALPPSSAEERRYQPGRKPNGGGQGEHGEPWGQS